jgi:hypothetical protein
MGEMRSAYSILVGKLEGKRAFDGLGIDGRIMIKMDLRQIRYESEDLIY